MRMSRSRISAGADLKELHAAQMAHRGLRSPPPVPPIPTNLNPNPVPETRITPPTPAVAEMPAVAVGGPIADEPESFHDEPEDISLEDKRTDDEPAPIVAPAPVPAPQPIPVAAPAPVVAAPAVPPPPSFANIPPPPPLSSIQAPPPPPVQSTEVPPAFKEPPPEVDDDLPPRPSFKEPPPEHEETELPMPNFPDRVSSPPLPMPNFADPPAEPLTPPARSPPAHFSRHNVGSNGSRPSSPKTIKSTSPPPRRGSRGGSISSRSVSPNKAEAQAAAGISGSPTTSSPGGISRVGGVRGPRGVGGGSVGNMVKNFNRQSASFANGTSISTRASTSPTGNTFSGTGVRRGTASNGSGSSASGNSVSSHVKRSSASRASTFERRTMASDAEEDVVQ